MPVDRSWTNTRLSAIYLSIPSDTPLQGIRFLENLDRRTVSYLVGNSGSIPVRQTYASMTRRKIYSLVTSALISPTGAAINALKGSRSRLPGRCVSAIGLATAEATPLQAKTPRDL
jgi:hypothetical protein